MSRSGNSNGDSGPDGGLPDLPPDWGHIVIPDDAAELAAEAAAVRRELRRRSRATRESWRRWRSPFPVLLLLLVALLATAAGLVGAIRAGPSRQPTETASPPATDGDGPGTGNVLPALELAGERGELVSLRSLLPALIMLVDGCACGAELDAALLVAPPDVTVVAVTAGPAPPGPPVGQARLRRLVDPTGELRHVLRLPTPSGRPTAVLVGKSATIVRTVPDYRTPEQVRTDLPELSGR